MRFKVMAKNQSIWISTCLCFCFTVLLREYFSLRVSLSYDIASWSSKSTKIKPRSDRL